VSSLASQVAEIVDSRPGTPATAVPQAVDDLYAMTEPHYQPTAYQCFLDAQSAHDRGDLELALAGYERALEIEPSMAAAHTNVGNILFARGNLPAARAAYERALDCDPNLIEARFNLGNLLDDLSETELAIAELKRVCQAAPEFADAHYNLGLLLARIGGHTQAATYLARYLELDPKSEWAVRARSVMAEARP